MSFLFFIFFSRRLYLGLLLQFFILVILNLPKERRLILLWLRMRSQGFIWIRLPNYSSRDIVFFFFNFKRMFLSGSRANCICDEFNLVGVIRKAWKMHSLSGWWSHLRKLLQGLLIQKLPWVAGMLLQRLYILGCLTGKVK